MIVVGLPNVGKSSLINALRKLGVNKGKVAQVGPTAGVTQRIQTRVKIHEDPPIYLVDTPGIFDPYVASPMQGLKIALTGGTKDRLTEEINVVDYLIFRLNNSAHATTWYKRIGLKEPSDDVDFVLKHIASQNSLYIADLNRNKRIHDPSALAQEEGYAFAFGEACQPYVTSSPVDSDSQSSPNQGPVVLDIERAARHILQLFREGQFGTITLDDCSQNGLRTFFENEGKDPKELDSATLEKLSS